MEGREKEGEGWVLAVQTGWWCQTKAVWLKKMERRRWCQEKDEEKFSFFL